MKNVKSIAIALVVAFTALTASAQTKKIDASKSTIAWVGKKVTGQHNGTVNFKDGALTFKGGKLTGGTFTIDMNSIVATDLKAGEGKEKLEGHLKADDFFGTATNPTSTLVFTSVKEKSKNVYTVTADLTIKGKTAPVTFDLTTGKKAASTAFNVDRTKYGITFGSKNFFEGIGDKAVYDEFELTVKLVY